MSNQILIKSMTKLQLMHNWLFPESEPIKPEIDLISNKRFIFMVTVGITFIILMEKLLN